jgi:hypothetical protein
LGKFLDIVDVQISCLDFQVIEPKLASQKREKQVEAKTRKPLSISIDLCPYTGDQSRFGNPKYDSLEIKPKAR